LTGSANARSLLRSRSLLCFRAWSRRSAASTRQAAQDAFNLGVDFKGGTVVVAKFKGERPSDDDIRASLHEVGVSDPVIQASTDKPDEVLIKVPLVENTAAQVQPETPPEGQEVGGAPDTKAQVQAGRQTVKSALDRFGAEAEGDASLDASPDAVYKIVGTDSVGAVAGSKLRKPGRLPRHSLD
jgi:preprotein translocase subunit SecF